MDSSPSTHILHTPSGPMSIPRPDRGLQYSPPPPPLPPSTNVDDPGRVHANPHPLWSSFNNPDWQGFRLAARPPCPLTNLQLRSRSSLDESSHSHLPHPMDRTGRQSSSRPSGGAHEKDTQGDDGQPTISPTRLHSERQLEQKSLNTSSQAYDRNLLSRIGGPNTPLRLASLSSSVGDVSMSSPTGPDARMPAMKRLSEPERRRSSNESHLSASRTPSTVSIMTPPPPAFRSNSIFSPNARQAQNGHSLSVSSAASHMSESHHMRDLTIHDRASVAPDDLAGARAGTKRRASSPQRDSGRLDRGSVSSGLGTAATADLYHRRSLQHLEPRFTPPTNRASYTQNGSVSSVSSSINGPGPRSASWASSLGVSIASSATSINSGGLSPNTLLSPAHMDPDLYHPAHHSKSLEPSPRSSLVHVPPLQRHIHETETASQALSNMAELPQQPQQQQQQQHQHQQHHQSIPGILICDCCPKKPKKFNTEAELRTHHLEKQYTCAYCPNRFKNKNEAERHQSSLHLRRHSWSCVALQTIEHAFHTSPGGASDICGYCGDVFPNPADWNARRQHVSTVHKFGECNQVKKFFRADHFRQHLKHSHGGTSGKWTNVLETVCMRDEPLPQPINRTPPGSLSYYGHHGVSATAATASGPSTNAPVTKPETINEVPQER